MGKYFPNVGDYLYLDNYEPTGDRVYCQVIDVQDNLIAVQDCNIINKLTNSILVKGDNKGAITILY